VRLLAAASVVVAMVLGFGLVYSGSASELPDGTRIAGVDVGGMSTKQAVFLLKRRSQRLQDVPVTFRVGERRWQIRPRTLGVEVDWARAVAEAQSRAGGVPVIRGYKRLRLRLFPEDIVPAVRAYDAAVSYEVGRLANAVDHPQRPARLVRRGLTYEIVRGRAGVQLDRKATEAVVVEALAGFARKPVALPVTLEPPSVTRRQLARAERLAERAVSAPVTLRIGAAYHELSPRRLAPMLELPNAQGEKLSLGGPAATAYFRSLDQAVGKPAQDAHFVVDGGGRITIEPSQTGIEVDVARTSAGVLAAASRTARRSAPIVVTKAQPERTTAEARAMGITGIVGSYETQYGGIANRIHNVQLVAHLVDGTLIAPGSTFSFNETTGERTAEKGFLEAPVIINGELQTGLGGGVCQVSTTVFNAAYEAGLPIETRTNHALYISHYPLGRDATVDYPGIDLKFRNDTQHWLLLRTFVGSSSLVVNLYGTPQNRRVESEAAPLRVVSPAPVIRKRDQSIAPGTWVIESGGVPAQSTSVRRQVYAANGKLLSDATWYSSYVAEPRVILLGPKKKPKPAATPKVPAVVGEDGEDTAPTDPAVTTTTAPG
jgi:vancomycin resistance protein YoaR